MHGSWQATLKPYKHQITHLKNLSHLGREVDIVIYAENFFFCCEFRREERENPDGRAQTYPTKR